MIFDKLLVFKTFKYKAFFLYSLKQEKHHTICNTIFSLRADTLRHHYKQDDFRLLKNGYGKRIEEYIKA